jgi:TonB family protein
MKLTLALLFGLSLWQPAVTQDAGQQGCEQHADRVYTTKEVDEKAKPTYRQEPAYPAKMRRKGTRGQTRLRVVLRPDGRVTDIEVLESSHEEFGKASVEAAKKIRFEPATKGGCPVAQSTIIINHYSTF